MIRLVWTNGLPAERKGAVRNARPAFDAGSGASKVDANVELGAVIACSIVEAMLRCGIARPEQAEFVLTQVADRYDAIAADAPVEICESPEWNDFRGRCESAAAMIRACVLDMMLG